MMGHRPSSGLGMKTSEGQRLTHILHPSHISELKIAGLLGVAILGTAKTFIASSIEELVDVVRHALVKTAHQTLQQHIRYNVKSI